MLNRFDLKTDRNSVCNITAQIKDYVEKSGLQRGVCVVFIPHTTAGLTISSVWDPKGLEDIQDELNRIVPTRIDFKHQHDTPQDASGHIKSAMVGVSLSLIVEDSHLLLGHSQGIFFVEFDGPRSRQFFVKVMDGD